MPVIARADGERAFVIVLCERSNELLADRLVRAGVPCAPIHDVPAALADPHTQHRDMVVAMGDKYRCVASPIKWSRTPATFRVEPPKAS